MKIYLIRHGEPNWNQKGCFQGSADIPLNEYGIELAEITSEALKDVPFQIIFSSPLVRARKTAEVMRRERPIDIVIDERLREMNFGKGEGALIKEARENPDHAMHNFVMHPEKHVANGGETFGDVIVRCRDFIENVLIPAEKMYDTVLVAGHGALIRCFLRCIEERPLENFWTDAPQRNCAVTILNLENGKFQIVEEGKLYYETKRVTPI